MLTVRFATLEGSSIKTVRTEDFDTDAQALLAVKQYAETAGFTNVKAVSDEDGYSLRYTATTPGGRHGRNVAFADIGYGE